MSTAVSKVQAERSKKILFELVAQPGNDVCADCKTKAPRWASHNLGIFICVHCASVHRKIGTHVTKVKSLTLDSWSKDQVETMKNIGNVKSNRLYNPVESRHPLPVNLEDGSRDSELEKYIRNKYEYKRFMDRSATVAAHLGPSQSKATYLSTGSLPPRPKTAPLKSSSPVVTPTKTADQTKLNLLGASPAVQSTASLAVPTSRERSHSASMGSSSQLSSTAGQQQQRSSTQPFLAGASSPFANRTSPFGTQLTSQQAPQAPGPSNPMLSMQTSAQDSSLPLQFSTPVNVTPPTPFNQPFFATSMGGLGTPLTPNTNPYANLSANGVGINGINPGFSNSNLRSASLPVFPSQPTGYQTQPTDPFQLSGVQPLGLGAQFTAQPSPINDPFTSTQFTQAYNNPSSYGTQFNPQSMTPFQQLAPAPVPTPSPQPFQHQLAPSPQSFQQLAPSPQPFQQLASSPQPFQQQLAPSPQPFQQLSPSPQTFQQPFQQQVAPSPFSSGFGVASQSQTFQTMSPPQMVNTPGGSPMSHRAQQAQKLFQSMVPGGGSGGSNNPFGGGGGWGS